MESIYARYGDSLGVIETFFSAHKIEKQQSEDVFGSSFKGTVMSPAEVLFKHLVLPNEL